MLKIILSPKEFARDKRFPTFTYTKEKRLKLSMMKILPQPELNRQENEISDNFTMIINIKTTKEKKSPLVSYVSIANSRKPIT